MVFFHWISTNVRKKRRKKNDRSKKAGKRMKNIEQRRGDGKIRREDKEINIRKIS